MSGTRRRGEEIPIESIHVPTALLVAFAAGELGEIRRARVYAHTCCCTDCNARLAYATHRYVLGSEPNSRTTMVEAEVPSLDLAQRSDIDEALTRGTADPTIGMRSWIRTRAGRMAMAPTLVLIVATLVWWVGPTKRVDAFRMGHVPPRAITQAARRLAVDYNMYIPGFSAPGTRGTRVADEYDAPDAAALRVATDVLRDRYNRGQIGRAPLRWLVAGSLAQGRIDDAERFSRAGVRQFEGAAEFVTLQAISEWARGNISRARSLLERAERLRPRDRTIQFDLAVVLSMAGDDDSAAAHFRRARALATNAAAGSFVRSAPH